VDRLLALAAEQARVLVAASAATLVVCDPDSGAVEADAVAGLGPGFATAWRREAAGGPGSELYEVRRSRDAVVSADVATDARLAPLAPLLLAAGVRRSLAVPLLACDDCLGALVLYFSGVELISADTIDYAQALADQVAAALRHARLHAQARSDARHLESRLNEVIGLQRVGTMLLEERDFDRVLQSICQQLQALTDAGGVGLALLMDDASPTLELRTVVGPSAEALRGARIPIEGSFAGQALRTNRPQRSDDAQNDPRGYQWSLRLGNTRTILSVPMKTRQRTVGVLSIYNKRGDVGFTERDAELATFFGNQAAVAIENARLYEETREYTVIGERNRLARELHDSVTQSLFSVTLLSRAALTLWDRDRAKARERLERANEVAHGALAEMRALIFQLRPTALQEEGLLSALKKHLAAVQSRDALSVTLSVDGWQRRLPVPVEEAAFRIVQESLNNVVKHAHATATRVEVHFGQTALRICTTDDGVGFTVSGRGEARTLGMASMRERAEAVGGMVDVWSSPGKGCRVCVELPTWGGEG